MPSTNFFTELDLDNVFGEFGREVDVTVVTQTTDNLTGEETLVEGATTTEVMWFVRPNAQQFDYIKAGFLEVGDAVAMAKFSLGLQKDYLIAADGLKYRIKEKIDLPGIFDNTSPGTTLTTTMCNLFLFE